ncbi:MAG: Ribosomal RNA small subunit methyltransferase I [candidate division TA06 bacterium ADurb.Bin417]|uniref:Ribosomal RNA small subunit methyltransferase I n=1 Tax=candidate division TA06 bacterium ADurb.Bin417 TaxID=1852828 RepID=A0A1V5MDV2_UNCT6|nr:MAG: Ribosomal RNA small subunit methyltransferase I [candidate division TA06 bacterium ADurb.Bin417]
MGALNRGENVAIVSSRGTPGISDPAYLLVRAAHQAGLPVVPIPGASSLAAALSASGVPTDRFCFVGFLPRRPSKRRRIIEELKTRDETAVIYESPHRFLKTMSELHSALGDRELTICRELTKKFEEIRLGGFADLIEHFSSRPVRGEFIIILRASSSKEKHDQIPGQEEGI